MAALADAIFWRVLVAIRFLGGFPFNIEELKLWEAGKVRLKYKPVWNLLALISGSLLLCYLCTSCFELLLSNNRPLFDAISVAKWLYFLNEIGVILIVQYHLWMRRYDLHSLVKRFLNSFQLLPKSSTKFPKANCGTWFLVVLFFFSCCTVISSYIGVFVTMKTDIHLAHVISLVNFSVSMVHKIIICTLYKHFMDILSFNYGSAFNHILNLTGDQSYAKDKMQLPTTNWAKCDVTAAARVVYMTDDNKRLLQNYFGLPVLIILLQGVISLIMGAYFAVFLLNCLF